jgi:ubiquinone/menaquinone biosynthesis C-methylase UbiE
MRSWSEHAIPLLLERFDFSSCRRIADICGGDATNAIAIANAYPSLGSITLIDLPGNAHLARERIERASLADRIEVIEADIFAEEFPRDHDCFLFIHVLVIWSREVVIALLEKTYRALPAGGFVVIFSSISSDDGKGPLMAALDTAYFVSLPTGGGMIYAWKDYEECLIQAGFVKFGRIHCQSWTPHGIVVAIK